jgi:DNA-binding transcriptional LysR family regulator
MDQRLLSSFVVLAEELHFRRAAERLGISQPPLSQRIRQLEEMVGFRLLERTSRSVTLTDAGAAFAEEARMLLERSDAAIARARRIARGEVGELVVAMTTSIPLLPWSAPVVAAFREARPQVRLVLEERHTAEQLEGLATGAIHAGFLRLPGEEPPADPGIAALALGREPLALFLSAHDPLARRSGPIALTELADRPFVMFTGHGRMALREQALGACRAAGFEPAIAAETRETMMLCGLVASGAGVAILPRSFARIGIPEMAVAELADPCPILTTWLAYAAPIRSSLVRAFLTAARRAIV